MLRERRPLIHISTALVVAATATMLLPTGLAAAPDTRGAQCTLPETGSREGAASRGDPHLLSPEEAEELDAQLRSTAPDRIPQAQRNAVVPVAVHLITAEDGSGDHDDATVLDQVDTLNRAFGGEYGGDDTGFRFELRTVTRTANDDWFSTFPAHENEAKRSLRVGGAETLNLYTADLGVGLLGTSSFPQHFEDRPQHDGVVVDYRTLPGGGSPGFDLGHTATHETGHWLGLFHTFQNGCTPPGDYVDDTAYEREPSRGCPTGRDTCPRDPGDDPVTNFMNYSDDACLKEFTRGQADRMWRAWWAFRG